MPFQKHKLDKILPDHLRQTFPKRDEFRRNMTNFNGLKPAGKSDYVIEDV